MIVLPADDPSEAELWNALLDLADQSADWTLIGARMVQVHAVSAGRILARLSRDGDALADARKKPNPVKAIARILVDAGFELTEPSYMGLGHEFKRGNVAIDVLAPEHLGDNSLEARTTLPGAHTVGVPGGRQALARTASVEVRVGPRVGSLPVPNLLGAILLKAKAVDVDDVPDNQRSDLALLLSLTKNVDALAAELEGNERRWLAKRREMDDPNAKCWLGMTPAAAQRGLAALRQLAGWHR
jgi:hypothetical protein